MMAGRTPRAARTLIRQVREGLNRKPDSKAGIETAVAVDEPDGLGVHRAFKFDKVASKWLVDHFPPQDRWDERIVETADDKGALTVIFSPQTIADDSIAFDLGGSEPVEEPAP